MTLPLVLYLATLALLAVHAAHRMAMIRRFRGLGTPGEPEGAISSDGDLPLVTVQLPLYDERTVAARLIRAIGALDYPAERFEVQVLDDSTDETRAIVDREVAALVAAGLDAKVVRRGSRAGYKAGALAAGLAVARGELVAIFDADFAPRPDFLRALVPRFVDPRVGMVQARWEHENRDASALTRAQSVLLDGHFVIEHTVRHDSGWFFNFNGTAGVWRAAAIRDAGGWSHDTLTEDLDLSYRAQLAGWRFVYAPLVTAPAEVPPSITGFQSQQDRWARGCVQVMRKQFAAILRASLAPRVKVEAAMHLGAYGGYPLVLALALLLPFTVVSAAVPGAVGWLHLGAFLFCTASTVAFYDAGQRAVGRRATARLREVPAAIVLGIGMSVGLTRAVLLGLFGGVGEFVRTPKRGSDDVRGVAGYPARTHGVPGIELCVAAWIGVAIARAAANGLWGALPFLVLFAVAFTWVGGMSIRERIRSSGHARAD